MIAFGSAFIDNNSDYFEFNKFKTLRHMWYFFPDYL